MKIQCKICRCKFNPEKTGGICPDCGRRADNLDIEQTREKNKVSGDSLKEILKSYLNAKINQKSKKSFFRKKCVQIPLCCVLTAAIIGVVVYGFVNYGKSVDEYRDLRSSYDMKTDSFNMGDTVNLMDSYIKVTDCREVKYAGDYISEGYKIIGITYERGEHARYSRLSDVYLKYDDIYCKPVDRYFLQKLLEIDDIHMKKVVYHDYLTAKTDDEEESAQLLFAVPEDKQEFILTAFQMSAEKNTKNKAERKIEITVRESDV